MIVDTIRGKEDWHHPYCVAEYKRSKDKRIDWTCICELMDRYVPSEYVVLTNAYKKRVK